MKASNHCAVLLVCVFAKCTCVIVGFAVFWLTCKFDILTAQYYIFMKVKQDFTKMQWWFYNIFFFFFFLVK